MKPAFKASCSWNLIDNTNNDVSERIHFLQSNDNQEHLQTVTPPSRFSASTQSSAPSILIVFDNPFIISDLSILCNAKTVEFYQDDEYLLTERASDVPSDSATPIAETLWTTNGNLGQDTQFGKSIMMKFFSLPKTRNSQGKRVTADFLLQSISIRLSPITSITSHNAEPPVPAVPAELSKANIDAAIKPSVDMLALLDRLKGLPITNATPEDAPALSKATGINAIIPSIMKHMELNQESVDSKRSENLPQMPAPSPIPPPPPPPPTEHPSNNVQVQPSLDVLSLFSRLESLEQTVRMLATDADQTSFHKTMMAPSGQPPSYSTNVALTTAKQSQTTVVERLERLENRLQKVTENFDQKLDLLARSTAAITAQLELLNTTKLQGVINSKD